MMMRRLDDACARLNAGLSAIALALALATGAMATVRFAEAAAGAPSFLDPLVQAAQAEARLAAQLW